MFHARLFRRKWFGIRNIYRYFIQRARKFSSIEQSVVILEGTLKIMENWARGVDKTEINAAKGSLNLCERVSTPRIKNF
jgi:hypothetical protein